MWDRKAERIEKYLKKKNRIKLKERRHNNKGTKQKGNNKDDRE